MTSWAIPIAHAGLSGAEARRRLDTHGRNEVPAAEHRGWWRLVAELVREPMLLLLLVATGLYVAFGDALEAGALGVSVLAIITITLIQERRTERALDALRELAAPHARALRDGAWVDLDARELVPGDIVHVAEGERAPADALLREGTPLTVDESLLTGESVPVVHVPEPGERTLGAPGERGPSLFGGTLVTGGEAVAEVVHTGTHTQVGRIGASLASVDLARSPLRTELVGVVRRIAIIALALSVLLSAIHVGLGHGVLVASLAGITLAISLLPEELPLVLTVFLTLGARRIARHRVLARRGEAIETLGAVTVLCVDKTGTLTRNRMAIRRVATSVVADVEPGTPLPEEVHDAIEYGVLACSRRATDAMDRAFAELAATTLADTEHVHPRWSWVHEYPLSRELLAVTHVWRDERGRAVVATKGAPEAIVELCHLADDVAERWRSIAHDMARDGLRVLGVARAFATHDGVTAASAHDYAFELVGMVGLADPLRDETAATIATCHRAGVRVVMITGDHPATARAIGHAAGLDADDVVTGDVLDALDDDALQRRLRDVEVIARAAPAHKLRIIRALQANGDVVAMTGDGVNDAPALRAADVGIAMGRGTDVAREASGLVILDDALGSIVAALRLGRTIYDNLRKVAAYLLAVHVPIAGLALIPPLVDWPLLLLPIHVVFLELVIDPTCSIVFEQEPPARDVMDRPPRGKSEHLFVASRVVHAVLLGLAALVGPLVVVAVARANGLGDAAVRALAFIALVSAEVALSLVSREHVRRGVRNRSMVWMVAIVVAMMTAAVAIPAARTLFAFAISGIDHVGLAIGAGIVPVILGGSLLRRAHH